MKKYVVINADDFGLSHGTNKGIIKTHKDGVLTSVSMFATTPGFEGGIKLIKKNPKLGVGVHLSLTWGKSIIDSKYFNPSYLHLITKSLDKKFLEDTKKELEAQILKILDAGIKVDHLNSQQHVHMIPGIYNVVVELAKKYNIKFVRHSNEPFFLLYTLPEFISPFYDTNFIKFMLMKTFSILDKPIIDTTFYGLMYTTKTNQKVLEAIFKKIKPGVTEILSHPALYELSKKDQEFNFDKQIATPFMKDQTRKMELDSLVAPKIGKLIKKHNIIPTTYHQLANL